MVFVAEYDATDYENPSRERHPDGRKQDSPVNVGVKYRYGPIDLGMSYVRGRELAGSLSASLPLGSTQGFLTKTKDPLPYCRPVNTQCLGSRRPPKRLMAELHCVFQEQGFTLLSGSVFEDACRGKVLRLAIAVDRFREEFCVRKRITESVNGDS